VSGEEILPIDRFIIDMGMLSYPADFPLGNLHAISTISSWVAKFRNID